MNCILLKKNYDINKILEDIQIAKELHDFINPDILNRKTFSLSEKTHGWEALPLHTLDGKDGVDSTIPIDIRINNNYKPNRVLKKCNYIKKILDDLETEIYLVRIMKLKPGGFIYPHIDSIIDKNYVIRCQIPIVSNPDVDFFMDNKKLNLESGNLYFLNVGEKEHWLKNNSSIDRLTLIIDLKPTDEIKKKIL